MSEKVSKQIGRRDFLKFASLVSGGVIMAACAPTAPAAPAAPAQPAGATPTTAPAAKGNVTVRATSQMAIDQLNGFGATIKDDLAKKNITLDVYQTTMANWSEYADKVITQIAGGEQVDVIMIAIEGIPLLGSKDIFVDLAPYLTADPKTTEMINTDIAPVLTDMLKYKGKLLEIPFSWNNMVLYYNTKIMADAGVTMPMHMTWDDFLQISQKVANVTGAATDRYAYNFWPSGVFGWESWLYMNGGQGYLTDDMVNSNLNSPKVAETIQFMADLVLKYKVSPNPKGWDEQGQFLAGNVVMRTCGRWCIAGLLQNKFTDYDLVYQPHKEGSIITDAGTDGWGVCSKTKTPNEAYDVAVAMSGPGPSLAMTKLGGNIPALKSVANLPEFTQFGPKNTAIFYESLSGAKALQAPVNFNVIEPLVDRNFAPIWNGEISVADGLAKAHAELQAEMDKIKGQ
jgi:multiple sugar transport system substrate-binding protein